VLGTAFEGSDIGKRLVKEVRIAGWRGLESLVMRVGLWD